MEPDTPSKKTMVVNVIDHTILDLYLIDDRTLEWTPKMREPVNPSNTWNGEYWDDFSEKVFQGV